jgi:hypothetical protein
VYVHALEPAGSTLGFPQRGALDSQSKFSLFSGVNLNIRLLSEKLFLMFRADGT